MKVTSAVFAAAMFAIAIPAMADTTVRVGGQEMFPSKTIVDNAANSADHTTLVAAVKAAGLVDALEGKGPFTVFAPVNAAFAALPAGTVDTLLKPENKPALTKVLTYHVVAGSYPTSRLRAMIRDGGGEATLKSLEGDTLRVMMNGPTNLILVDDKGGVADITVSDVRQSNGVIQVIDKVLMP
jgi:uncharacterized surface protein with fasciclin (FAS1) repeats